MSLDLFKYVCLVKSLKRINQDNRKLNPLNATVKTHELRMLARGDLAEVDRV